MKNLLTFVVSLIVTTALFAGNENDSLFVELTLLNS
jgi:hypothetical protein